ncbi:MAG: hypothetical protein ACYC9O_15385 [Candidatus Latescibacterota bacterium]
MTYKQQGSYVVVLYLCVTILLTFCCILAGCLTSSEEKEEPEKQAVEVDTALLDFGEELKTLSFSVKPAVKETEWRLQGLVPEWCSVEVKKTETGGQVTVKINRTSLSPGDYSTSITVVWDSGSHEVKIHAAVPETSKETGTIIIDIPLPEKEEIRR